MTMVNRNRFVRAICTAVLLVPWFLSSAPVLAQEEIALPIDRFVTDIRGSLSLFGQNRQFASARGLNTSMTPRIGLGFEVGAHAYLYRWRIITIGIGGTVHKSLGTKGAIQAESHTKAPAIRANFFAISPQLSLNFGSRDGWSYLSGGLGSSTLGLYPAGTEHNTRYTRSLNYGGGARWFTSDHIAFSLDLRFYALTPLPRTHLQPGSPRITLAVFNIGASFR